MKAGAFATMRSWMRFEPTQALLHAKLTRPCATMVADVRKFAKRQKRQIALIAATADDDIGLSEMPEVVGWSGAEVGKFYRPLEKPDRGR